MNIRSTSLYEYLLSSGALDGTPEDIARAKREYRKKYKREWKKNKQLPHRELRPSFSLKDYEALKVRAGEMGYENPTAYIKQLILASLEQKSIVPHREQLEQILQYVSMALNAVIKAEYTLDKRYVQVLLSEAEIKLSTYLL